MTRIRCMSNLSLTIVLAAGLAGSIRSAELDAPKKITLHPQPEPTPALKYRLLPPFTEQIPGNAAVDYGKVTAEQMNFFNFGNRALWDKIEDVWQEMPLDQLKRENVGLPSSSIYFLEQGARRKYCDWQLPIGEMPFYGILLPEAQQSRSYARVLAVKARREIAQGKFDEAIKTIRTGFALGRHVAQGETIVNGLIGIAISGIMFPQALELIQQPDAPNLYWALALLPSPLVEVRAALDVEAMGVELSFPELRDVRTAKYTPEEWREMFHRFAGDVMKQIRSSESPEPPSMEKLDELCHQKFAAAKQALIATGLPAADVAGMSEYQVALLYSLQTYHELADDAIKYFHQPYPQAIAGIDAAIERAKREQLEIIPIGEQLLPAIRVSRRAIARNDREIAALRVLEALRMYGASHDGQLPDRLEDITEVPIPGDPFTSRPFVYLRKGEKALLKSPALPDPTSILHQPLNYEISMVSATD